MALIKEHEFSDVEIDLLAEINRENHESIQSICNRLPYNYKTVYNNVKQLEQMKVIQSKKRTISIKGRPGFRIKIDWLNLHKHKRMISRKLQFIEEKIVSMDLRLSQLRVTSHNLKQLVNDLEENYALAAIGLK